MTTLNRRTFLKGTLAGGILTVAATAGLLAPRAVLAESRTHSHQNPEFAAQ